MLTICRLYNIIFFQLRQESVGLLITNNIVKLRKIYIMVSLTLIALGLSVTTTSLLTLHDSLKQLQHAKGFATFLLTQNIQTNAKYALNYITNTIGQRYNEKGQQIKNNIFNASFDFVNQSFNVLQEEIQKKIKLVNIQSLIQYIKKQQEKINQGYKIREIDQQKQKQKIINDNKQQNQTIYKRFVNKFKNYKSLLRKQFDKEIDYYWSSVHRQKQKQTLISLYNIYRENIGLKNDSWITPYNIIMMLLLGVSSFFFPKLTIMLAISYFISSQLYLLSDSIVSATNWEIFNCLKFQSMFYFHVGVLGSYAGYWKYQGNGKQGQGIINNQGRINLHGLNIQF